ncbi:MAG: type I methionyl aminopeptidase [Candidatus Margulisiibacteriota bacterium]
MGSVKIKSSEEIDKLRIAGKITANVLEQVSKEAVEGITTAELDKFADKLVRGYGAEPVFVGYRGYRHATCISINHEVVHGIPGEKVLCDGDIVSIDIGVKINGYCGDSAVTVPVGKASTKVQKLLRVGKNSLRGAIKQARAGNHLGDIAYATQREAEKHGYSVVRELYGHGIGRELHEDPLIPNFGRPGEGIVLKPGMVFAIEPMVNIGGWRVKTLSDGWTVVTEDGSLSCHFEHMVLITEGEPEVLTLWQKKKM